MEIIAERYLSALRDLDASTPSSKALFFSSVEGKQLGGESMDAGYWVKTWSLKFGSRTL